MRSKKAVSMEQTRRVGKNKNGRANRRCEERGEEGGS